MRRSYYLENIPAKHKENPRHFLKPTDQEIADLKVGDLVRLFFVFKFKTNENCTAERMWVQISEIYNDRKIGILTNIPRFIKDIKVGDSIEFKNENIATLFTEQTFDEEKRAIITKKAYMEREINWLIRVDPINDNDSGWQLLYGDEDENYIQNLDNCTLIRLGDVIQFEPKLEQVFESGNNVYEWNSAKNDFVKVS